MRRESLSVKSTRPPGKSADEGGRVAAFIGWMGLTVTTASVGDVMLKKGLTELPAVTIPGFLHPFQFGLNALSNRWFAVGVLLMLVHFYAFVRALRLGPLSLVVPLRASAYIFTTLLARWVLLEHVPPARWLSIAVILVGVSLLSFGANVTPRVTL